MSKASKAISLFLALACLVACAQTEEEMIADLEAKKAREERAEQQENARLRAEAVEKERLKAEAEAEEKKKKAAKARENVVTLAVVGLASVVSGGNSQKSTAPAGDSFAARNAAMNATYDRTRYRIAQGTPSPGAEAAASGIAVYEGHANIKTDQTLPNSTSFAIGKARIEANFAQNTISGKIDRFLNPSDAPLNGSMTLANGQITRADRTNIATRDDTISADLSGNLDVSGSDTTVNGTMSGNFREGQIPEPIVPAGPGYITGNINLTTGTAQPLYGGFTVTRQ